MNNPFSLSGKTILVTGASSGIGRSVAIRCSEMGANVVLTARNNQRLEETLSLMQEGNHLIIHADITNKIQVEQLVDSIPSLDGIVHCAGISKRQTTKFIDYQDIEEIINPNFTSPVVLQSLLLQKKKVNKESSIVFIASRAANAPSVGNALYSASKGAIISYSKVLALELAPRKIRVNCICPAMVLTNLISDVFNDEQALQEAQQKYPLKRYGQPDDIAYLTIYLLSNTSNWMTGSCIDITGGGEGILVL